MIPYQAFAFISSSYKSAIGFFIYRTPDGKSIDTSIPRYFGFRDKQETRVFHLGKTARDRLRKHQRELERLNNE